MRRGSIVLTSCILGLLSGCGGSDDDSSGGGGAVAIEDLPDEIAEVQCDIVERCIGVYAEIVPQADCELTLSSEIQNSDFAAIEAAIEAGAVSYDPARTRACLDAIRDQGCDIFSERIPDVCDEALSGDVPLGSPCSIDAECAGLAFCAVTDRCPGVCAERRAEDGDCASDDNCENGLSCQSGTCRPVATAGQACEGPDGDACRPGLVCAGATDTASGTCADSATITSRGVGEACDLAALELCEPELSCVYSGASATGLTFECRVKSASGAACTLGFPEPCPSGEYCNVGLAATDGDCAPLPGEGEPCLLAENRPLVCAAGLVCINGECSTRKANGGACDGPAECYSENCVAGTCEGTEFCTE